MPCVRARSASVSRQLWYELRLSSPVRSSETPIRRTSERSRVWLTLIKHLIANGLQKISLVRPPFVRLDMPHNQHSSGRLRLFVRDHHAERRR